MDFPAFETFRLIGASPDAMRALYGFIALWVLVTLALLIVFAIARCTVDILFERSWLRQRALERVRGIA